MVEIFLNFYNNAGKRTSNDAEVRKGRTADVPVPDLVKAAIAVTAVSPDTIFEYSHTSHLALRYQSLVKSFLTLEKWRPLNLRGYERFRVRRPEPKDP